MESWTRMLPRRISKTVAHSSFSFSCLICSTRKVARRDDHGGRDGDDSTLGNRNPRPEGNRTERTGRTVHKPWPTFSRCTTKHFGLLHILLNLLEALGSRRKTGTTLRWSTEIWTGTRFPRKQTRTDTKETWRKSKLQLGLAQVDIRYNPAICSKNHWFGKLNCFGKATLTQRNRWRHETLRPIIRK